MEPQINYVDKFQPINGRQCSKRKKKTPKCLFQIKIKVPGILEKMDPTEME